MGNSRSERTAGQLNAQRHATGDYSENAHCISADELGLSRLKIGEGGQTLHVERDFFNIAVHNLSGYMN